MGPLRAAGLSVQKALDVGPTVQLEAHDNVLIYFQMKRKQELLGGRQCVNI